MNMTMLHTFRGLAALPVLALAATAQDLTVEAPPQSAPIVIFGATIHVGDGQVIDGGALWFDEGEIRGIGPSVEAAGAPVDATRVDLSGRHVWPGLISAYTRVGLEEIGSISATHDYDEIGNVTPEVYAAVAVNPDATTIPVTRSNGVLTVGVFPSGGMMPGRASVLELAGWTWEEMALRGRAGLVIDWPTAVSWRGRSDDAERRALESRAEIDRRFDDAAAWVAARAADPDVPVDLRHAALAPVLAGEQPVFLVANDVESIRSSLTWALERGLKPILVGGADAELCLDLLTGHDVPVIVAGTHRLPRRRDHAFDRPFRLPKVLDDAGVRFCISGDGGYENERNLPYHAAKAAAFGLPPERARQAITRDAAAILGLGDELGTLAPGKRATLIVTDGDPLEITTRVHAAWASGRRV